MNLKKIESNNKNRIVIYTALFGNYDNLIDPPHNCNDCDFICFTDQKHLKSKIWEIRFIDICDLPSNLMNRKYKIMPHLFLKEYENSIYIDSNIALLSNPVKLFNKYITEKKLIAAPRHLTRDCVYKEAIVVREKKMVPLENLNLQLEFYKNEGMPQNCGMNEMNVIFRKHNEISIIKAMELWFSLITKYTARDQLSFPYVKWKLDLRVETVKESTREINGYYFAMPHKNSAIVDKIKINFKYYISRMILHFR